MEAPQIFDAETDEMLVDLSGTPWSLDGEYYPTPSSVRLVLRCFPGAEPSVHLEVSAHSSIASITCMRAVQVSDVREVLLGLAATFRLKPIYLDATDALRHSSYAGATAAEARLSIDWLEGAALRVSLNAAPSSVDEGLFDDGGPLYRLAVAGGWLERFEALAQAAAEIHQASTLVNVVRRLPSGIKSGKGAGYAADTRSRAWKRKISGGIGAAVWLGGLVALGYYVAWYVPLGIVVALGLGFWYVIANMRIM